MSNDITVVIPAYKAEATIGNTIKSLELQTDNHFDVLVVEDGFDSAQRIALYDLMNSPNGLYINDTLLQKNRGVGYARNTGLKLAHSPYICFLDADDYLLPNAIANFREFLDKEPDFIIGKTMREGKNGHFQVVGREHVTWVHGRLYRKKFLEEYGILFPNLPMSEDLAFNSLSTEFATRMYETNWPVHIQRYREGSLSRSADAELRQALTYIKAAIYYVEQASRYKGPEDMGLLPQFIAMSYFYLDAAPSLPVVSDHYATYREMCMDFIRLTSLVDLGGLLGTPWREKLTNALFLPIRPYNHAPIPMELSFEARWADAKRVVEEENKK